MRTNVPSKFNGCADLYIRARNAPTLSDEEERALTRDWPHNQDPKAVKRVMTSYLRLVFKESKPYLTFCPAADIVSAGYTGLLEGLKRFDGSKGFKVSTYVKWWIKAEIQRLVSESLIVRPSISSGPKRVTLHLRAEMEKEGITDTNALDYAKIVRIAERLNTNPETVLSVIPCLSERVSLNTPLVDRHGDSAGMQKMDALVDENAVDPEIACMEKKDGDYRVKMLRRAVERLEPRIRRIFILRRLTEPPSTLRDLADEFGVSHERIRQLEVKALKKLREHILELQKEDEEKRQAKLCEYAE